MRKERRENERMREKREEKAGDQRVIEWRKREKRE